MLRRKRGFAMNVTRLVVTPLLRDLIRVPDRQGPLSGALWPCYHLGMDITELHGREDAFEERRNEGFRRCSYCGSVHPLDLLKARDEGRIGKVDRSVDWKYGWPHKIYVDVNGHFAKFYSIHTCEPWLANEERKRLFEFVGYSFELKGGNITFKRWVYDQKPISECALPEQCLPSKPSYVYLAPEVSRDDAIATLQEIARFAEHKPNPEGHYCDCACCKARKLLGVPASVLLYYDPS